VAHLRDLDILGSGLLEDVLVGESGQGRAHVVLLTHLEVLSEVLVTAPPVQVDHGQPLVTACLMEVSVPDVVLDTVGWESSVAIQGAVGLVDLTDSVAPVINHALLLVLDHDVQEETAPQVEDDQAPEETNTVLSVEGLHFPVEVAHWVLHEAGDVFEGSPALGIVTRFLSVVNELEEVTISVLGQSSM